MPRNTVIYKKTYWSTHDDESVRLYLGDVKDVLYRLPPRSVQCVVTSPPYWSLRDYGTGTWEGGDSGCDHIKPGLPTNLLERGASRLVGGVSTQNTSKLVNGYKEQCGKCGAKRVDKQIGSEPSPDCGTHGKAKCGQCFICTMVEVFDGVERVLRNDGTCWLNLGDTYGASSNRNGIGGGLGGEGRKPNNPSLRRSDDTGLSEGNLVGIPWRVALALQANGWVLRQDIVWSKPSPMPESVTNRCTKSHEYIFLLTKGMGYFYDAEAIKESAKSSYKDTDFLPVSATSFVDTNRHTSATGASMNGRKGEVRNQTANKRSVWSVSSQGYPGCHYATFPPKLIEPCILAGSRINDIILDPFMGSGTTAEVCLKLGRRVWGIDLSEKYLVQNAIPRIVDTVLSDYDIEKRVGGLPDSTDVDAVRKKLAASKVKEGIASLFDDGD